MVLILCIHAHSETGGSAKFPMSMMVLNDVVKRGAHPSAFKCRLLIPSSLKSVSLWEVASGETPMEDLGEWLNSGILSEPGLINELGEADELLSVGLSHLGAVRAAERVASTSKQTAATAAASLASFSSNSASLFKRGWEGISPALSNLGREYWQGGAKDPSSPREPSTSSDPQPPLMTQRSTRTSMSGNSPGLSREASLGSRSGLALPLSAASAVEGVQKLVSAPSKAHLDEDDGSLGFNKLQISQEKSSSKGEIEDLI